MNFPREGEGVPSPYSPWSLFFARLHGLKTAWKLSEIEVKLLSRTKRRYFLARNYLQRGRYKN